jgi:hypothetical protein
VNRNHASRVTHRSVFRDLAERGHGRSVALHDLIWSSHSSC